MAAREVTIEYNEEERIKALFLGRTLTKVADNRLVLDDGTVVQVVPNDGGCACSAGDYELAHLAESIDAIITAVEFADVPLEEGWGSDAHSYRVFVVAAERRVNLFTVDGDDGNGFYGTGYWLTVKEAT